MAQLSLPDRLIFRLKSETKPPAKFTFWPDGRKEYHYDHWPLELPREYRNAIDTAILEYCESTEHDHP